MKIAIVAPSPVPFVIGGIENLVWSLCDYINQHTAHQAELIKIPSRELGFWELIDSYYQFYRLDLSHFDAVICSKYPAWMIEHPNCIYYVAHRLRGLYDTYHTMGLPWEVTSDDPWVRAVLGYMRDYPHPETLDSFFELVFRMKQESKAGNDVFSFPGPLIRLLVHYMDDFAFRRNRPERYYAISKTVADRKEYFPENAEVIPVYPPSNLKEAGCGEFRHLFIVSRLDYPKRIDLLVRAMKFVKSDIPLYIAGTGPAAEQLKALAGDDPRIRFLGFVTDAEVERYYADALVIPYFPEEEDYGYITIEAMMHGKPVITLADSGGPMEFVRNGETGFIAEGTPEAIAEKIDWFAKHPDDARKMGRRAKDEVSGISWANVCKTLLEPDGKKKKESRLRVSVLSTFPIWPPMGGGQARIYNLYRKVTEICDVNVLALCYQDSTRKLKKGYTEICVSKSGEQQTLESSMNARAGIPVNDITTLLYAGKTPGYTELLRKEIAESEITVVSHPYTYYEAKPFLEGKRFIYEAHNVESYMKQGMIPDSPVKEELLRITYEAEKECCEKSELILTCSEEDKKHLHELYGVSEEKMLVIPNGVDCEIYPDTDPGLRGIRKNQLLGEDKKTGVFMGSWHEPNLEACREIFKIARLCPDTVFLLMGSQCLYFEQRNEALPGNVCMLGLVSEEEKERIFSAVDFALNPMLSGSGTNLKMFDYMAAGIPIITTLFGTRGIDRKDLFVIAEPVTGMAKAIREFSPEGSRAMILEARNYVRETFDWKVISGPLKSYISNTVPECRS